MEIPEFLMEEMIRALNYVPKTDYNGLLPDTYSLARQLTRYLQDHKKRLLEGKEQTNTVQMDLENLIEELKQQNK